MNINAQELSILRKNMKFGEAQPTATTSPVAEPPVSKPESGLNALEAQANNNIAFQGLGNSTILTKLRNKSATYMLAALMAASAPMMTSCVKNEAIATVDLSPLFEYMKENNELLKQILAEQKLSREIQEQSLAIQEENNVLLQGMYENSVLTLQEVRNISSTLTNGIADIISHLKANGATDKDILAAITGFRSDVNALTQQLKEGEISLFEYLDAINNAINEAKQILNDILTEVKGLRDDIANNHKEYMAAREEEIELLSNIYKNGKIQTEYMAGNDEILKAMKDHLANLEQNSKDLINIITDKDNYNKFIEDLKSLMPSDIDYEKFEAMFNAYGLKVEDVINMSSEKLVAIIQDFMTNELANDAKGNELLDSINQKLKFLENFPNFSLGDLQASIDALTTAYKNGNGDVLALMKDVIAKMDVVIAKLDVVVGNTGEIIENMNNQQAMWDKAISLFGDNNELLKEIKAGQKVSNEYLAGFGQNFDEIAKNQKTQTSYLNILTNDIAAVRKAVEDLELTVNVEGGMTREEFESVLAERDPKMLAAFQELAKKYGYDKVPGDVQTIKDLLGDLNDLVANKADYSAQLDKIIGLESDIYNFLKTMDFSDPAQVAKLDKIITLLENWKCNCDCNKPANENDESIKDLEDLFGKN